MFKKTAYILVIALMILIGVQVVLAEEIIIQEGQLPYSNSITASLNYEANKVLFIKQLQTNPYLNLTFPSSIISSNITQFNISYTINPFLIINQQEILNGTLMINDTENVSFYYLTFKINRFLSQDSFFNISFLNSTYLINTTLDLLPQTGTIKFKLIGLPGQNINISCGEWLTCPTFMVFKENVSILNVDYFIPKDASVGEYIRLITFLNANTTITQEVKFQILVPSIFLHQCGFDYGSCLSSPTKEEYLKCVARGIAEEQQCQQLQKQEFYKLGLKMFDNQSQIKEIERLVMVGSVDNELKGLYDACSFQIDNFKQEMGFCSEQRTILTNDKIALQNIVNNQNEEFSRSRSLLYNETQKLIQIERNGKRIRTYILIVIAVIFIAGGHFKRKYKQRNMTDF